MLSGAPIPDVPMGGPEGDDDGAYGDEGDDGGADSGTAGLGQYNLPPETL